MCAMRNNKRNSLPSLTLNKFFVNKRASMFERHEETPREKREWSPCGLVETSQRKMEARKEKEKKEEMRARLKRQADPYAEQSSDGEEEELSAATDTRDHPLKNESKACGHVTRAITLNQVKKTLKQGQVIGECTQCRKGHRKEPKGDTAANDTLEPYDPVIWLCLSCGHQGCDRNTPEQHALLHYRTPRSSLHCVILNTQAWNVWCYECDSDIQQTSSKRLHETVEYIKRQRDMAPRRTNSSTTSSSTRSVLNSYQYPGGGDTGAITVAKGPLTKGSFVNTFDSDNSKAAKNQRNAQASVLASLPKVKGLSNLGNTCFFNSVMQSMSQTHFLTQLLDVQCQSGQHMYLPGRPSAADLCLPGDRGWEGGGKAAMWQDKKHAPTTENGRIQQKLKEEEKEQRLQENEDDEDMELKPLDLILPEGGGLTLATAAFLKDMHSIGKNPTLNPGHLFGQICKKSTQFQGYEQQDAHELLRCLLEAIRNEEILRAKRAILRAFALSEKTDPNTVSPSLKTMIKGYGRQATHTIVDQIFGGHLISTVFCEECHWSSQVFEPMMDLSLPINEEKGKPKKSSPDDETVFDCFGRPAGSSSTGGLSKHQQKKQKKENKKQRRSTKGQSKGGGGGGVGVSASSCIRASAEDKEEDWKRRGSRSSSKKNINTKEERQQQQEDHKQQLCRKNVDERRKRRETEKSRPEDHQEKRGEEEQETVAARRQGGGEEGAAEGGKGEGRRKVKLQRGGESFRVKQMMAARKLERRNQQSDEEESDDLESEDDVEDDKQEEEVNSAKDRNGNHKTRVPAGSEGSEKTDRSKEELRTTGTEKDGGESESDSDDDEDEDESEETESKGNDSDAGSSKKRGSSTGISDADVEDNNSDSERVRPHRYHNTRQPSIVVEQTAGQDQHDQRPRTSSSERAAVVNSRLLNTCNNSSDQLNYNSASDTSERYYTPYERDCNGLDTGDDLDHFHDPAERGGDNTSLRSDNTTNTSGKASSCMTGDTFSISSGDTINNFDVGASEHKVAVDQAHMEEMCLKVKELKIRRKSCSKESLLDTTQRHSQKRRSTETLHTFIEQRAGEEEEPEDDNYKKSKYMKKLKQEWIARSLTTLAPRYQCRNQECSVMSCLTNFTAPELLTGNNKITCENCTKLHNQLHPDDQKDSVKSNASKQMLILSPPAVLTLQLKRFHHQGFNLTKVNRYVQFPLVLDIAPFTSSISLGLGNMSRGQSRVLYGLYGVVEHSGRLNSGHYVAYVRSRPLDPSRTKKQYLNLKPSSQFEINQLVAEMAEKIDVSSGSLLLNNDLKGSGEGGANSVNVAEFEEEVRAGRWFHVSDTYVAEVNMDRVLKSQAYLLFYERLV